MANHLESVPFCHVFGIVLAWLGTFVGCEVGSVHFSGKSYLEWMVASATIFASFYLLVGLVSVLQLWLARFDIVEMAAVSRLSDSLSRLTALSSVNF